MKKIIFYLIIAYSSSILAGNNNDTADTHITKSDSLKLKNLMTTIWKKRSNEPIVAIQLAKEAQALSKKMGNLSKEALINNFLGIIYTNIGAYDIAFEYHHAALKLAQSAADSEQLAYSNNNIGGIYRIKKNSALASESIQTALKLFEEEQNFRGMSYCYINMGRLYKDQEYFDRALDYFDRALELAEKINNQDMTARILLDIADLSMDRGYYDRAKQTYSELQTLYQNIDYRKGLAEVWLGFALLNMNDKKYNEALSYALKSLKMNKEIMNYEGEVNSLNRISLIHLEKGNLKAARKTLNEALEIAKGQKDAFILMSTYETLYDFFKETGNTTHALIYHEKYHRLRDSVFSKAEMVKLGELESLLQLEKAERENQLLQKDLESNTTQLNFSIVISILLLIMIIILATAYNYNRKIRKQLEETNFIKDKFFRIIAHDLREPFSALFGAAELLKENYNELSEEERVETIDTIGQTVKTNYDLLENLLLWARSHSNVISFEPVNLNLKNIVTNIVALINNSIKKKNITVQINCPDNITVKADEQMLNSIIRNLLINAVKFTYLEGKINIDVVTTNHSVKITVSDTGLGMNNETKGNLFRLDKKTVSRGTAGESGAGLGLIVTKEFVEKHNGTIEVESEEGKGSKFTVTLPVS